ncbi:MAG: nucleotidyltransferase family protein [Thermodesulfobacteriota bacterium]
MAKAPRPCDFRLGPGQTVRQIMDCLNRNQKGIVIVTDRRGRLLGAINDGDLRRALLAGKDMTATAHDILAMKQAAGQPPPVTAPLGSSRSHLLGLMQKRQVRQIPLLDAEGRVAELVTWADLMPEETAPFQAVIMAGGRGARLAPLTGDCPKPMLPVGDRPLLERIIEQLRQAGIRRVNVSTCYLAEKIHAHFGDGRGLGVELNYVTEEKPLGTAGALGLLDRPDEPLLIINGDILTQMDFRAMLQFHEEHQAALTVGVRKYEVSVPFGVVTTNGPYVEALEEKPQYSLFVNAGVYLLEPGVVQFVTSGERLDMTDLIARLLAAGERVVSFPIIEYWLDVGSHSDYQRAQQDYQNGVLT